MILGLGTFSHSLLYLVKLVYFTGLGIKAIPEILA